MLKFSKLNVLVAVLILSLNQGNINANDYGGGTPGATTTEQRIEVVKRDASHIACEGNLCKIFSINIDSQKFTIGANLGDSRTGGGYYGGYYGGGTIPNPDGPTNNIGRFSAGITVTWEDANCTKTINVDKAVYDSVTEYMKLLVNRDGTTNPSFTPAEQTMIVFYTTIMQLLRGSTCN